MAYKTLTMLMKTLNYRFNNKKLLKRSLKHRSLSSENNERLEFLGDAILNVTISQLLFDQFPNAKEGQLSRLRSVLVNQKTLAKLARHLKLGQYLNLGAGEIKNGGANRDSILSDALEAIIGAICVDSHMQQSNKFIQRIYKNELLSLSLSQNHKDAKTTLQEYLQALKQPLPQYCLKHVSGKEHKQHFFVSCQCSLLVTDMIGDGTSRRRAEQKAAMLTLKKLKENEPVN